jgi:hypothetical protein
MVVVLMSFFSFGRAGSIVSPFFLSILNLEQHANVDAIRDHHNRRMKKLEEMIEERRVLVEDHEAGSRRLSDEDYNRAATQHRNFNRKLEQMRSKTTDVSSFCDLILCFSVATLCCKYSSLVYGLSCLSKYSSHVGSL